MFDPIYEPIDDQFDLPLGKIPSVWLSMLARVRKRFPTAIIAGGCLRDTVLQKSVKDVDIFFRSESDTDEIEEMLKADGIGAAFNGTKEYENASHSTITGVWDFSPFQFISLSTPCSMAQVLASFDLGICMIATDGQRVLVTPEFRRDAENKTMTLYRSRDKKISINHFYRLRNKYTNWQLVDQMRETK